MPSGRLLKQSYLDVLQEPHLYNSSWYNHLMDLASRFQCSKQDPASKIRNIMERHYKELWLQSIQCNNKLRTFKRFKHEFKLENYLLHESLENRKNLTRLRISSHKLAVETGRYINIALNERLCQLCECNAVEDEYHFVMNCPFYENLRSELKQSFDSFTCLFNCDHDDIFLTLMSANNGDHEFVKIFCKYVNLGFQLRFDHLNSARHM